MATVAQTPYSPTTMNNTQDSRSCGGCHKSVEVDTGGVVVAFGNSLWHVQCFKCAKCGNRVSADTNLLLLSDGSPVCAACSYNCAVCKKPISDEAIMTGDESYHSACFTCKTCGRHIGELVFAKTTQGIYCMSCHNDRVARSRRHAEQRRNRSKSRRDKDKDRLREKPSSSHLRENGTTTPDVQTPPTTPGLRHSPPDATVSYSAKRISTQSVAATLHNSRHPAIIPPPLPPSLEERSPASSQLPPALPSPTIATSTPSSPPPRVSPPAGGPAPSPPSSSTYPSRLTPPAEERSNTLPLPGSADPGGSRRKSFDDGVRPLNGLLSPEAVSSLSRAPSTSGARPSRADKRSSINPALRSEWAARGPVLDAQPQLSPTSLSPTSLSPTGDAFGAQRLPRRSHESDERSASPYSRQRRGSPDSRSPTAESFYSTPSSPSYVDSFYCRSQTDSLSGQSMDLPQERRSSLPDTARPSLNRTDSSPGSVSGSGRASPYDYEAPNGSTSTFVQPQQQRVAMSEQPQRKLPELPVDETQRPATDEEPSEDENEDGDDEDHTHTTVTVPLALPPMSFHEGDTSFQDLLKLGSRQSVVERESAKAASRPGSQQFEAGPSKASSQPRRTESPRPRRDQSPQPPRGQSPQPPRDASPLPLRTMSPLPPRTMSPQPLRTMSPQPSRTMSPQPSRTMSPQPSRTMSPQPSRAMSPQPLGTQSPLPPRGSSLAQEPHLRNGGLARKMSARKPVPIVLPGFDSDMTLDMDESSNAPSSPRPNGRPERRSESDRRPYSAGAGPPPISPRSAARRSSDRPLSGSSLAVDSTPTRSTSNPVVTVTDAGSGRTARPGLGRQDTTELVAKRIKEALADALENGASTVRLDRDFLEVIYLAVQASRDKLSDMRGKYDGIKRASQQVMDGLSVAQVEYDMELAARREAEAEVTRLKIQLSGQAARLTELSADERKREVVQQISRDMSANLHGLERDLSKLKTERDLTVAEVEELTATKASTAPNEVTLQRSLTSRFDKLKSQYKRELEPLVQQREALLREISELKEERNICLEETTALNARNEELAELNRQTERRTEAGTNNGHMRTWQSTPSSLATQQQLQTPSTPSKSTPLPPVPLYGSSPSISTGTTLHEEHEPRANVKLKGWFKPSREPIRPANEAQAPPVQEKETLRHNFQQLTVLRLARCDQCGEKMWGTQLRCNICTFGCHNRCAGQVTVSCVSDPRPRDEAAHLLPLPPSMFGRDLIEQVRADSAKEHRDIPVIVEKCILAVELLAIDYEGIYRKTGGSSQSKAITQLFERGNYDAFDLSNPETFNDISSVTSVLKTYFRQLPNPLLTHVLHDAFVNAAIIREPRGKAESLGSLVYQLPSEHFHTLRYLMLHLYRIQQRCSENLMTARNLGVVFGPTLMRSKDPNREFADMAGKALAIEWLIENAPTVFRTQDE